jgi:Tfp pilus assembly protein FimT
MLVVISIIAVLAAFAVPALTSALTKGQMTGHNEQWSTGYISQRNRWLSMVLPTPDPNLAWPGDYASGVTSLADLLQQARS